MTGCRYAMPMHFFRRLGISIVVVWLVCGQVLAGNDLEARLAALQQRGNVSSRLVDVYRDGADVVQAWVTVKGFDVDPPFYRPVIDDPPERRRESFALIVALLRAHTGDNEDGFLIEGNPDDAIGLFRLDLELIELVAAHPRTYAIHVVRVDSPAISPVDTNLTGAWFSPGIPGQGLFLDAHPSGGGNGAGVLFGAWATFLPGWDGEAGQRWFTLAGESPSGRGEIILAVGAAYGGNFAAPPAVGVESVGQAYLHFLTCNIADLSFSLDSGTPDEIELRRLLPIPGCSDDDPGLAGLFALSGSWFDPQTSGQGLLIEVNPDSSILLASWLTFAPNGQLVGGEASQAWYTLQAALPPAGATFNDVPIFESTGGRFISASAVTTRQVGLATLSFSSCSTAILSFAFDQGVHAGASGDLLLSRAGSEPEACGL